MVVLSTKSVHETLLRYFSSVTDMGYVSKASVKRIFAMMFFNELINSDMSFFMDDKDYDQIARAVRMITGDCLIPYTHYCNNKLRLGLNSAIVGSPMLFDTDVYLRERHSQEDIRRFAETTEERMAQGISY